MRSQLQSPEQPVEASEARVWRWAEIQVPTLRKDVQAPSSSERPREDAYVCQGAGAC